MATNVTFTLDADQARAVNSFLKVVDSQKKSERQFRKTTNAAKRQDQRLKRATQTMRTMAGTLLGGAGLVGGLAGLARGLNDTADRLVQFDNALTPLLSLGDNVENIGEIRKQVLDMSSAWGVARDTIASTLFNLQSGTANLSKTIQDELLQSSLRLTKVVGGELDTNLTALIKTYQVYRGELDGVGDAQNRLLFAAQEGFLTFQDLAVLLPDVLPAAKELGFSLNDVLAALVTATQVGGRNEKTFTGVRNVFLRMSKAQKEGIELTGTFTDRLRQLDQQADTETLKKIFGDEAITTAATLVRQTDEVAKNLSKMNELPDGIVDKKIGERLADPSSRLSQNLQSLQQLVENLQVGGNEFAGGKAGGAVSEFQANKAGVLASLPEAIRFERLAGTIAGATQALNAVGILGREEAFETAGRGLLNQTLEQQGRGDLATINRLEGGDLEVATPTGFRQTNAQDAERFARLSGERGINESQFLQLLTQEAQGRIQTQEQLNRTLNQMERAARALSGETRRNSQSSRNAGTEAN